MRVRPSEIHTIARDLGILDAIVEQGRKHIKVFIEGPLGKRMVVTSSSPSDYRSMLNFRSDLRRHAREIGAII